MAFNSRDYDPGPIPDMGSQGTDPLDASIEIWRSVVDRFYRRRILAWTVWAGFWAVPGGMLAVLSANPDVLISTPDCYAWFVGIPAVLVYGGLWRWAIETVTSHRRDHAHGYWFMFRIYGRIGLQTQTEKEIAEAAGHLGVGLDIWLPLAITTLVYWVAVGETIVRILQ